MHMASRTRIVAAVPNYGCLGLPFVFHVRDKGNAQRSMNVEDCVISTVCNAIQLRLTW